MWGSKAAPPKRPKCVVRRCKNNHKPKTRINGISYFHFPRDPVLHHDWVAAVSAARKEEYWKPNVTSVICSDHFAPGDIYITERGLKRVRKTAIPRFKDFSPLPEEQLESSDEEQTKKKPGAAVEGQIKRKKVPIQKNFKGTILAYRQKLREMAKENHNLRKRVKRLKNRNYELKYLVRCMIEKKISDKDLYEELVKIV